MSKPKSKIQVKMHTVRKYQIVSKNKIFRKNSKSVNLNFRAKNERIIVIYEFYYNLNFEFSRQKMSNFNNFLLLLILFINKNHDFWRENSNCPGKSTI